MWIEVIAGPRTRVPPMDLRREHRQSLVPQACGSAVAECGRDIVAAPKGEDAAVQDVGRRCCRILLVEGAAAQFGADAALCYRDLERTERAARRLCERLVAGLPMQPHEEARSLPLRHPREPGRGDLEGVRERLAMQEPAFEMTFPLLVRCQVTSRRERPLQPAVLTCVQVPLVASEAPLRLRDVVGTRSDPPWRPTVLVRLDGQVDVVAAQPFGVDVPTRHEQQRARRAEEPCSLGLRPRGHSRITCLWRKSRF